MQRFTLVCLGIALTLFMGCTATRLRIQSVQHAGTLDDIFQQQTLDNLAKFARDPYALPDYAVPTSGLSQIADNGEVSGGLGWAGRIFDSASLGGKASRKAQTDWTMKPVSDPRKLERMRCLLQSAVATSCGIESQCPDCEKSLNKFFYGEAVPTVKSLPPSEVTPDCLTSRWFHVACEGCKRSKYDECCLIGEHCGRYVCVPRGHGSDQLALLTIALLDIAQNEPPTTAKKKVKAYLTDEGFLTTEDKASFVVERELPANVSAVGALSPTERKINEAIVDAYRELGIIPTKANSNINFSNDQLGDEAKQDFREKLKEKLEANDVFGDPGLSDPGLDIVDPKPVDNFFPRDQVFQRQIERFSN